MSRISVADDSTNESFARLLERLAQKADGVETDAAIGHDSGSVLNINLDADSVTLSKDASVSVAVRRSLKRALSPVAELKADGKRMSSESTELSYEKALRIHGRRKLNSEADYDPSSTDLSSTEFSNTKLANLEPLKLNPQLIEEAANQRPQIKVSGKGASQNRGARAIATKGSAKRVSARPSVRSKAPVANRIQNHTPERLPSKTRPSLETKSKRRESDNLALDLQKGAQLEGRRTVISVRLSDAELAELQQRAAESGISVSAYVRSCVTEADHLRAQVKHALAEMRTYIRQSEAARLPAFSGEADSSSKTSGLSRLLSRSAALLLGGWLSFRGRA